MKKQFSPIVSIYAERTKFYDARQGESETVTEWYTRIRSLAVLCEFGDHLEHALKDKFITGSHKGPVLDKLYELEPAETLAKCVEAALKRELTKNQKLINQNKNRRHSKLIS